MAIIGIDLGTTNSLACAWREGACVLIPNRTGAYLTPSVVSLDEKQHIFYTGAIARDRLISHPQLSASLFKRTMGTAQTYQLDGKAYQSEELSSLIIKQLVDDAQAFLHEPIEEAVISVPAYFNDTQRSATKNAGALAGIKVERLINEPSAAALYARNSMEDATFLVFDFGGGTLDISIVECFANVISILAVCGDNHLGGTDFDEEIARIFCARHQLSYDQLSTKDRSILLGQCEECKIALSDHDKVSQDILLFNRAYPFTITNQELISQAPELFERILIPIEKALHDADLHPEELDQIIMVGGSSKMPVIQKFLEHKLSTPVISNYHPDTIVALGIGMYTGIKQREEEIKDLVLTDICPFTLGTSIHNEANPHQPLMAPIIERNTTLPASIEKLFYTIHDHQPSVEIDIYQGESVYAKKNLLLGKKTLKVKKAKAGEHPIKVRFTYDINGILDVDLLDTGSQHTENILITSSSSNMSEQELKQKHRELDALKVNPRDLEANKALMARIERLFEETNGEMREQIQMLAKQFEYLLEKQDPIKLERERKQIEQLVKELELQIHPHALQWS